ncbi:MAG TPA: hypothetical protein VKB88_01860 [Bryobacteraceae bacterium]|nr:hypothetical protein [Bryobacteraceae bacterium]
MNSGILWLTALALAAAEPAFPQTYFPAGVLPDAAAARYTRFLTAMHEPSLYELSKQKPGVEAYRLLWLRSDRRPASIRFAPKPGGTGWFYRHMTGGTGSTLPRGLRENGMSWSWKSRTASFLRTIDDAGFWNLAMASSDTRDFCHSHWILEGVRQGQYRVVDRCSPLEDDPIRIIGVRAMRLANLRVHGDQIY